VVPVNSNKNYFSLLCIIPLSCSLACTQ